MGAPLILLSLFATPFKLSANYLSHEAYYLIQEANKNEFFSTLPT
jgi:hypothetical protein